MSRIDSRQALVPSVLDRLIDPDSSGTAWRQGYGIEQVQEAVRRDLEDLLNTQRSAREVPEEFAELRHSMLNYGVPDVTSTRAVGPQLRDQIARTLEECIQTHEPRLRDIHAAPIDGDDPKQMRLRFHISAKLYVDPIPKWPSRLS